MRVPEGELELLLAEIRPVPDEHRARRIDARVARALAPRPPRTRRWRPTLLPAAGLAACAVVAVVIALAAQGGGTSGTSGGGGMSAGASSGAGSSASGSAGSSAAGAVRPPAGSPVTPQPSVGGRAIERSTTLRIGTPTRNVDAVAADASRVATSLGGYVASSEVTAGRSATLDLRVPGDRLDDAIQRLSQLGHVRSLSRSTLDITDQLTTARRRVQDARALRRSLLHRLAAASTERRADRLRGDLARATRRLTDARRAVRDIHGRTSDATIALTVTGERGHGAVAPGGGGPWTPGDALHDAGRILEVAAGVVLVALAVAAVPALLAALAWLAARRMRRARRERALDAAA